MSPGLMLVTVLAILLHGGFSGRFGGSGYGPTAAAVSEYSAILIIVVVLVPLGRL